MIAPPRLASDTIASHTAGSVPGRSIPRLQKSRNWRRHNCRRSQDCALEPFSTKPARSPAIRLADSPKPLTQASWANDEIIRAAALDFPPERRSEIKL